MIPPKYQIFDRFVFLLAISTRISFISKHIMSSWRKAENLHNWVNYSVYFKCGIYLLNKADIIAISYLTL